MATPMATMDMATTMAKGRLLLSPTMVMAIMAIMAMVTDIIMVAMVITMDIMVIHTTMDTMDTTTMARGRQRLILTMAMDTTAMVTDIMDMAITTDTMDMDTTMDIMDTMDTSMDKS